MSHTGSRQAVLRESLAPYLPDSAGRPASGGHEKISISLPPELVALVREVAAASGQSVSATIAAAILRALDDAEQARLDEALALDAEESGALLREVAPLSASLLSTLDW